MCRFVLLLTLAGALALSLRAAEEVNVYSHRHYDTDQALFAEFTRQTGIKVNVVKADADELLKRLELEGERSPADLLITADAGRLWRAQQRGLLRPVQSALLEAQIPAHLRAPDQSWFGLTLRARVLVYAKDRVKPESIPSYETLADPAWTGRLAVRSSQNIYNQSLLASLVAHLGPERAKAWAVGTVAHFARSPKGSDRDQIKAVAAGQADVALVNTYYLGLLLTSADEAERQVGQAVGIVFPNQGDRGTHVNISGGGVTRHAKHPEAAVRLLEFLTSEVAQQRFAEANCEYPVNPRVAWPPLLAGWGQFKADTLPMSELGRHQETAMKLFDEARWP
jgi:iron(III) transport system substrate-binding protein